MLKVNGMGFPCETPNTEKLKNGKVEYEVVMWVNTYFYRRRGKRLGSQTLLQANAPIDGSGQYLKR